MKRLSKEQVLLLHSQLIESFGGSYGVRDDNLLDAALETPFQTFDGEERRTCIPFGKSKDI